MPNKKSIYDLADELKTIATNVVAKLEHSKQDYPDDKLWSHGDVLTMLKDLDAKSEELKNGIREYDKDLRPGEEDGKETVRTCITNASKFKTAEERIKAFARFKKIRCDSDCGDCKSKPVCEHGVSDVTKFALWLDLPVEEEKPMPCFFCSNSTHTDHSKHDDYSVLCDHCGYRSEVCKTKEDAISKHNRTCKAVATYVANGGAKDKMLADMLKVCDILCPGHGGFEEKCLNCKCKALCDKYHSLQLEISEYREKVERDKAK